MHHIWNTLKSTMGEDFEWLNLIKWTQLLSKPINMLDINEYATIFDKLNLFSPVV